jgi:hypothetical protein
MNAGHFEPPPVSAKEAANDEILSKVFVCNFPNRSQVH